MRIEASQVSYTAAHRSTTSTVSIAVDAGRVRIQPPTDDMIRLSAMTPAGGSGEPAAIESLAALIVEVMSGRRIKWLGSFSTGAAPSAPMTVRDSAGPAAPQPVQQWLQLHSEAERTVFHAEGAVESADGRNIRFSARLDMQREFSSATLVAGPAQSTDPLVINLDGGPARLSGGKISFDLNSDGHPENISFVADGSGFLVLDANGDGKVNDGSELFGPRTGRGFGELAACDADRNGWIDETDPVYERLRVWDRNGLFTLVEKGIGAIATSSAETPFALRDDANQPQGDIRRTGIYLTEDGDAGTIQQVDLAVG